MSAVWRFTSFCIFLFFSSYWKWTPFLPSYPEWAALRQVSSDSWCLAKCSLMSDGWRLNIRHRSRKSRFPCGRKAMLAFSGLSPWCAQLAPARAILLTYRYSISGRFPSGNRSGMASSQNFLNVYPSRERKNIFVIWSFFACSARYWRKPPISGARKVYPSRNKSSREIFYTSWGIINCSKARPRQNGRPAP